MKKKLLFILTLLIFPLLVNADNINSVSMNIYINENGSVNVTEIWDVESTPNTVLTKKIPNIFKNNIIDYEIFADENKLESDSYGFTDYNDELLLWFNNNSNSIITIKYKINNMVYSYNDSKVFIWSTLLEINNAQLVEINVDSYFDFDENTILYSNLSPDAYIYNGNLCIDAQNNDINFLIKFSNDYFNLVNNEDKSLNLEYESENIIRVENNTLRKVTIENMNNIYDKKFSDNIIEYINKDGSLDVTEKIKLKTYNMDTWHFDLQLLPGTEISNFIVYLDNHEYSNYVININEKKDETYATLYIDNDAIGKHTITLKYKITNAVINVKNGQAFYTSLGFVNTSNTNAVISSYYNFDDNLKIDTFGNGINAYTLDGKIYVNIKTYDIYNHIILVKFDSNTYNTTYKNNKFNTYDKIYLIFGNKSNNISAPIIAIIIFILFMIFMAIISRKTNRYNILNEFEFEYENGKKIDINNVPYYKEIPCDKNVYYVNFLLRVNNYNYKKVNIMGAIILGWIKKNIVSIEPTKKTSYYGKTIKLKYNNCMDINNENEKKLFNIMKSLSTINKNNKKNSYKLYADCIHSCEFDILDALEKEEIVKKKIIRNNKFKYILSDKIYDDSIKLFGLLKYLNDFSRIENKESIDVKLWDEYLMFAYLFGNANKTIKEIKNIYPNVSDDISTYIDV